MGFYEAVQHHIDEPATGQAVGLDPLPYLIMLGCYAGQLGWVYLGPALGCVVEQGVEG